MNEQEIFDIQYRQVCKELEEISEQLKKTGTISDKDLERMDKLWHTKKCMLTADAMTEAQDYEKGVSGRRGRGMDGRYVSREQGNTSYTEGYSDGYSEAMNRMGQMNNGNSGHYPMPDYYPPRRW